MPAGYPSTDNPPEGLFKALKEWVQHRQARCMVFLDESTHFLSDWSAWYIEDIPDLYPNTNQLEALATANPSLYHCHNDTWCSRKRVDGVAQNVTAATGVQVISEVHRDGPKALLYLETHRVFTKESCTCASWWEWGACWHTWFARQVVWDNLKDLQKQGHAKCPERKPRKGSNWDNPDDDSRDQTPLTPVRKARPGRAKCPSVAEARRQAAMDNKEKKRKQKEQATDTPASKRSKTAARTGTGAAARSQPATSTPSGTGAAARSQLATSTPSGTRVAARSQSVTSTPSGTGAAARSQPTTSTPSSHPTRHSTSKDLCDGTWLSDMHLDTWSNLNAPHNINTIDHPCVYSFIAAYIERVRRGRAEKGS